MSNKLSIPHTADVQEAWEDALWTLPNHGADFYALLYTLGLTRAQVLELEATVNDYVASSDKSAFAAGYAAGLSAVKVVVMN